jgi:hypothetical protein
MMVEDIMLRQCIEADSTDNAIVSNGDSHLGH